jgi:hypothetical protein
MNRYLVTVIDPTGSLSWGGAVLPVQGLKQAPVAHAHAHAHAHDCGRESDDTNTSGEGPG